MFGAIMAFESAGNMELYPKVYGDRYFLIGRDYPDQAKRNDLEIREGRRTEVFVLVPGSNGICLSGCPASHIYLYYPIAKKKSLPTWCTEKSGYDVV